MASWITAVVGVAVIPFLMGYAIECCGGMVAAGRLAKAWLRGSNG